jgi:hypothetical protein
MIRRRPILRSAPKPKHSLCYNQLTVPYYTRALALGLPAYLGGVHFWAWITMGSAFAAGVGDFRMFYTAGYLVRTGRWSLLYDAAVQQAFQFSLFPSPLREYILPITYTHPPFEAMFFVPFSLFSLRVAYLVFLVLNLSLLALIFRCLMPQMGNLFAVYSWLPVALFLSFLPVAAALLTGQDSILLLGLLTAARLSLAASHEFSAGILLGCCVFRFQIALVILLLFALWRAWRLLLGSVLSSGLLAALSVWMIGGVGPYAVALRKLSTGIWAQPVRWMPTLRGILFAWGLRSHPHLLLLAWAGIAAGMLFLVSCYWRKGARVDQLLIAIPVASLLSYHSFLYDLSILLLPLAVWMNRAVGRKTEKADVWLIVLYISPLLFSYAPDYFYLAAFGILGVIIGQGFSVKVVPIESVTTRKPL